MSAVKRDPYKMARMEMEYLWGPVSAWASFPSIHRQGLDRAFNPPPVDTRMARATFFRKRKSPSRCA